jgi:hypothetical protein
MKFCMGFLKTAKARERNEENKSYAADHTDHRRSFRAQFTVARRTFE